MIRLGLLDCNSHLTVARTQLQHKHSEHDGEDVYFVIKWAPPKGISLGEFIFRVSNARCRHAHRALCFSAAFALVHEGPMVKNSIKSKRNWKSR